MTAVPPSRAYSLVPLLNPTVPSLSQPTVLPWSETRHLPFEQCHLMNSQQAQPIIRKMIENHGQSDREQFCVLLLNAKNKIVGVNIVSTGSVSSAHVCTSGCA